MLSPASILQRFLRCFVSKTAYDKEVLWSNVLQQKARVTIASVQLFRIASPNEIPKVLRLMLVHEQSLICSDTAIQGPS